MGTDHAQLRHPGAGPDPEWLGTTLDADFRQHDGKGWEADWLLIHTATAKADERRMPRP
jgi:hypothetical protein